MVNLTLNSYRSINESNLGCWK